MAMTLTKGCLIFCFAMMLAITTQAADSPTVAKTSVIQLYPGPDTQYELQSALINAVPGDIIELAAGVYEFESELNVVCDNLTIRGSGQEKTFLSFKNQSVGSGGLTATGNSFVIEDLTVQDTVGNGIKVLGARDVTFRRIRVEWTRGPKSTNGAYGIYPVECRNVLIEDSSAVGASDAGIYCGQCRDVIVRGCKAINNVAGIEIENTLHADVYNNVATGNTGGIMVFDLPGLNLVNGGDVRVFQNQVFGNNLQNFAPKGTMVADVPTGTGVMLMATDRVEIFDNEIKDHQTSNLLVVSFHVTERKINDKKYDPIPEAFSIHHNRFSGGGAKPSGEIGIKLSPIVGLPFPDIFYDGIVNTKKLVDGKMPEELRSQIRDNGKATFANAHLDKLSPANLFNGSYKVERSLEPFNVDVKSGEAVTLQPHAPPSGKGNPAVAVYRAAPKLLSGWKLFEEVDGIIVPASGLISYELITPLFSDHTSKHRMIRLPKEGKITWKEDSVLDFPIGTVIAKTFAYPDPTVDKTENERFLETRIEMLEESGWYGFSYLWNDDQTDAELRLGGASVNVSWHDAQGKQQTNRYQIPNANQCLVCHSQDGKFQPLGPTARNLNRKYHANDELSQLADWSKKQTLQNLPEKPISSMAKFDDPQSGSIDDRARAWMEVNCAHCHNPIGSARASGLDLRLSQRDPGQYGVFKSPVAAGKGTGGRRYDIVPGKPDESILMYRLETDEAGARMPSLARSMVFHESNELIREWITSLKK